MAIVVLASLRRAILRLPSRLGVFGQFRLGQVCLSITMATRTMAAITAMLVADGMDHDVCDVPCFTMRSQVSDLSSFCKTMTMLFFLLLASAVLTIHLVQPPFSGHYIRGAASHKQICEEMRDRQQQEPWMLLGSASSGSSSSPSSSSSSY